MSKTASMVLGVVVVVILAVIGVYAYTTAPTKAPSTVVPSQGTTDSVTNADVPVTTSTVVTTSGTAMMPPVADGKYHIVSDQSTVSFTLDEDLRGKRITVVGTTNQVTGAVKVDPAKLSTVQFDPIRINARTFVTDSEQRNNAIRRMILKTENDANEFIEFTPKNFIGAPASSTLGQAFPFKVVGDLKVSGMTREVTFDGTVVFNTLDQVSGSAQTKVHYADFGLSVPNLPFLANVDEEALLKLDFVAKR